MHYNSAWSCDYLAEDAQSAPSTGGGGGGDVGKRGASSDVPMDTPVATESFLSCEREGESTKTAEHCIGRQESKDSRSGAKAEAGNTCGAVQGAVSR